MRTEPPASTSRSRLTASRALASAFLLLAALGAPPAPAPVAEGRSLTLPSACSMVPPYPMQAKEFALIKEGDYFHLFWMRHDPRKPWDTTEKDLGHAISRDLVTWTQLDSVLPTRPDKWDSFHIWAPTILKQDGTFYMYYTGVTEVPYSWNMYQRIGLATSTNLFDWTRTDDPVLSGAMMPWVLSDSSRFEGCQFRDPFAMPDPATPGRTLLYYVGTPQADPAQLIVGVAQTTDMFGLTSIGPLWATGAAHYWGWCESPHVIEHNGLYYLFTTTVSGHPISFRTATSPLADSTAWSFRYRLYDMVGQDSLSDSWFGSETLSIPGHDYLAVLNSRGYQIDIYEIVWDSTGPGFSLATPQIGDDLGVPGATPEANLSLSVVPRTGPGAGVLLRLRLPGASEARVDLYDVGGRRVRTLHSGPLPAGETVVAWDGRRGDGEFAAAGVYFAALTAPAGRRVARVPVAN